MRDERPWLEVELPDRVGQVLGMLTDEEKQLLYWLARERYRGQGAICDLGAYLGGSAICFATGLRAAGWQGRRIHSYDFFQLGAFELARDFPDTPPPGNLTLPLYEENLRGFHDLLYVHSGDLYRQRWRDGPIEILFIDIAKSARTWDHVVSEFFPQLAPDGLLILQDYLFARSGPWHQVVMEKLADRFWLSGRTHRNSVLFEVVAPITPEDIEGCKWERIPQAERVALMEQAIARFDEDGRGVLAPVAARLAGDDSKAPQAPARSRRRSASRSA